MYLGLTLLVLVRERESLVDEIKGSCRAGALF